MALFRTLLIEERGKRNSCQMPFHQFPHYRHSSIIQFNTFMEIFDVYRWIKFSLHFLQQWWKKKVMFFSKKKKIKNLSSLCTCLLSAWRQWNSKCSTHMTYIIIQSYLNLIEKLFNSHKIFLHYSSPSSFQWMYLTKDLSYI